MTVLDLMVELAKYDLWEDKMTTSAKLTEILSLPSVDEQIDAMRAFMGAFIHNDEQRAVAYDPRFTDWLKANKDELVRRALSK